MPTGETKTMPLTPGNSKGMDQDKAIKAPQTKSHNSGSAPDSDGGGKRPSVVK